jgi:hypothetical protein
MAYAHYVLSFVHQNRRRLGDAEKAIVEAVRLEQEPNNFHRWAEIAELRGKFDDALAATAQALRLNAWHNPSILLRGKLLARAGKLQEAHALYMAALKHNPEDAAAQHALGSLQLQTGQSASALGTLREARRLDPISANDSAAIALAYGRLIWPLNLIDRIVFRWQLLPPKKRWLLFTLLAAVLTLGARSMGVGLEADTHSPIWIAICVLLANFFVLPFSFDMLATTVGHFALRREFRDPWYKLVLRPFVLAPAIGAHVAAVLLGFLMSIPSLTITVCLGVTTFPLLWASIQTSGSRLTGWVCFPLFFILMIFGTLGAIVLELASISAGVVFLTPVFAVAYFSDNIIRWTGSWRFRRNPHLIDAA